jgi:hypothetical protein
MQERIEAKRARYFFDSVAEMQAWIDRTPRKWRANSSESNDPDHDWDLNAGYAGACALARDGWNEGAQKVQDALKTFPLATPNPDTKTDFYGFRPHVARFCAGAPDCMIRHVREAPDGRRNVLTLIVPVNAMSRVGARAMANFGVALAQYVNQMETDGTRVEIIAAVVSKVSGWRVSAGIRVKYAEQPLDLATLAFAIGHPAMFRRLGFAIRERCHAPEDPGYGITEAARVDDIINCPPGAVVLNGMKDADANARTPEAGFEYVSQQIEKELERQERGA